MPRGDKSAIMQYSVPEIDVTRQRAIAATLSCLDDKIELNNKINANLEAQAQAIFKSWFVDFEPWGGVMPEDWNVFALKDVVTLTSGYSYKSTELQPSNIAMATIKNFERKGGFKTEGFKEIIVTGKAKTTQYVELFDILVAHTDLTQNADVIGNAELLMTMGAYERVIISLDIVKVQPSYPGLTKFVLASILKSSRFKGHALGYVNGTTVLHLSKKAIPEYTIALPGETMVLVNLNNMLEPIYRMIANNIAEFIKLAALRDTLLPKLMSGEIEVPVAEAIIQERS